MNTVGQQDKYKSSLRVSPSAGSGEPCMTECFWRDVQSRIGNFSCCIVFLWFVKSKSAPADTALVSVEQIDGSGWEKSFFIDHTFVHDDFHQHGNLIGIAEKTCMARHSAKHRCPWVMHISSHQPFPEIGILLGWGNGPFFHVGSRVESCAPEPKRAVKIVPSILVQRLSADSLHYFSQKNKIIVAVDIWLSAIDGWSKDPADHRIPPIRSHVQGVVHFYIVFRIVDFAEITRFGLHANTVWDLLVKRYPGLQTCLVQQHIPEWDIGFVGSPDPRDVFAQCSIKPDFFLIIQFHDGKGSGTNFCDGCHIIYRLLRHLFWSLIAHVSIGFLLDDFTIFDDQQSHSRSGFSTNGILDDGVYFCHFINADGCLIGRAKNLRCHCRHDNPRSCRKRSTNTNGEGALYGQFTIEHPCCSLLHNHIIFITDHDIFYITKTFCRIRISENEKGIWFWCVDGVYQTNHFVADTKIIGRKPGQFMHCHNNFVIAFKEFHKAICSSCRFWMIKHENICVITLPYRSSKSWVPVFANFYKGIVAER